MTLIEVLVSTLVMAVSSSAALGVWNQAAGEIQSAQLREEMALELETARIMTDRWLQSDAASAVVVDSTSADCRFKAEVLEAAVAERLPLGTDVSSRWSVDPKGLGHWLELSTKPQPSMPPLKRRLLLTPAAYGLCKQEEVRS